jgi:serine/threonine protein kinase
VFPDHYEEVEELYHAALEKGADERADFLNRPEIDAGVRREVESLLAYDARSAGFLEEPPDEMEAQVFGPVRVGQRVGPFEVLSMAGSGGMGDVYLAEDTRLKRTVAIKFLPAECNHDPDRIRRFEREARVISTLSQPNIITIYETGALDESPYLVTEYVPGVTLRDRISQGRVEPRAVLDIALQVAAALDAAHHAGIIHRDIKPENIMVRTDGLVKVLDFGLAKPDERAENIGSTWDTVLPTESGVALGTRTYMSPEQMLGRPVDARTDLFSMGIVLFELLTGQRPLPLGNPEADLPAPFQPIIARLLAEDPNRRYQSALELREDLQHIQPEIEAPRSGWLPVFMRKRRRLLGIMGVSLVLVAVWYRRDLLSGRSTEIKSLAVLPFRELNAQVDDGLLGFGIANEIITRVGQASRVAVRPTSAIRPYVHQNVDALAAARQLGVDAVVDGNFQRANGRIRFSAHLLRVLDSASLWAESVELPPADILDMEKDVAEKVAAKLTLRLANRQFSTRGTSNPQASEYFAKAVYYFGDRSFDPHNTAPVQTAIDLLRSAIELDPNYADARAQLAYAYAWSDWFIEQNQELVHRAEEEIDLAEKLDSALPSVHLVRSLLLCNWRGCDVERATKELLVAQKIDPSSAHGELAAMYRRMGLEEKEQEEEEAALRVDPTSAIFKEAAAFGRYASARPDDGLKASLRLLKRGPGAWYYVEKLMPDAAARALDQGDREVGDGTTCQAYTVKALIPALQGHYQEAEGQIPALLAKAKAWPILYNVVARVYALQGKNEDAMKWLRIWAENHNPSYPAYARDPFLARLRTYPPFIRFLADMKERWKHYRRAFG